MEEQDSGPIPMDIDSFPQPSDRVGRSNFYDSRTWDHILGVSRNGDAVAVPVASKINKVGVAALEKSKTSEKKENIDEKDCGNDRGFYDCNICFVLAKDPVLTCCGHLFCWPCLYRWLNTKSPLSFTRSSLAKECPVCKGEVTDKTVTPIYGGGNDVEVVRAEDSSSTTLQIPPRPNARRVSKAPKGLFANFSVSFSSRVYTL
ncbi:zinc finger, C3HC4 type (RING finger) protein [Medicago truncatula]|uniref:E3 ubiquitin-protein ligase RMA n=1 Tax=Medicago truncatula TaxID=3880 RepID=A0A072VI71_MEDTR|nr:zinc finger, C3HC4 type (RING finger) protein [Medicago truncatula]